MVTSSSPTSSSSMAMSVLRPSSPIISSSIPSIVSISSILIFSSSSSSSSPSLAFPSVQPSSTNHFEDCRKFLSSPTLTSSSISSSSSSSLTSSEPLLSSSFVPSFSMLKSPQKSQFVMRSSVTSRTASKCLFGPSDTRQNKIDCDKLMKLSTRRNVYHMGDSKPDIDKNKSIHCPARVHIFSHSNHELSPATKIRRTEGYLDGYKSPKKINTDKDDGTVWRSPKKFGNNLVRLIPKVTPLRRHCHKNCVDNGAALTDHKFNLLTFYNPSYPDLERGRKTSFGVDRSTPTQSNGQCHLQEMLPRRVPVVQLKPVYSFKLRRVSQSNPNSKQSNSDLDFGGEIRRSSSFSQLCSSLESISTQDFNNNTINDKPYAARKLNFPSSKTSPCTVTSTNPETDFSCHPRESMITSQDNEDIANVSPDSSVEDRWLSDDPYLRLIRERENLGFVPINKFDSRDETSGSLDD